jgi:2-amino-4-hydroxy-6-hydroxymethyldihydropteridine diphosphokinase
MTQQSTATQRVQAYIGIGANLGNAASQVVSAIDSLTQLPNTGLSTRSSLFRTTPLDADGDDYINAVVCLETSLTPHELLSALLAIELALGRQRPYHHAPRAIDLDILLYGQQRIDSPTLTVPHPRLTQRAFALIPLLQIAPFITIPGQGPAHTFVQDVAGQGILKVLVDGAIK